MVHEICALYMLSGSPAERQTSYRQAAERCKKNNLQSDVFGNLPGKLNYSPQLHNMILYFNMFKGFRATCILSVQVNVQYVQYVMSMVECSRLQQSIVVCSSVCCNAVIYYIINNFTVAFWCIICGSEKHSQSSGWAKEYCFKCYHMYNIIRSNSFNTLQA